MEIKSLGFILYFFLVLFIIFFTIFYVINFRKVKSKKFDNIREINDVIKRFKINKKKINYKKEIIYISLINSFIVSSVGTFVTCLNIPQVFQLAIGFVLLLALIYSLYELYGRHLRKKTKEK